MPIRDASPPMHVRLRSCLAVVAISLGLLSWLPGTTHEVPSPQQRTSSSPLDRRQHFGLIADDSRGLSEAVLALSSKQRGRREAAREVLVAKLDQWQQLRPGEAEVKLSALAEALADHIEMLDKHAQDVAAELARGILNWRISSRASSHPDLVVFCDRILHAGADRGRRMAASPFEEQAPATRRSAVDRSPDSDSSTSQHAWPFQALISELPGGGLPINAGQLPVPATLEPDAEAHPLDSTRRRGNVGLRRQSDHQAMTQDSARDDLQAPLLQPKSEIKRLGGTEGEIADENAQTVIWMHELRDLDSEVAARAESHLRKLGFRQTQLELARQLTSPDPAARKELAELLPQMTGIDVEMWLLWLGRDADPQVRLAALGVMATTGDPKTLHRVAKMARDDPDPRIQEQAQRIENKLRPRR